MVDSGKVLKLKLEGLCSEPLKKCNFVVVEIGALEDVKVFDAPLHEPAGSRYGQ